MAGQFRENWKRMANKLPPLNSGPTAQEEKDLVRIEDLNGFAGLTPSSGSLIVGSGNSWIQLPIGPEGYVVKSINGLIEWRPDGSGTGGGGGPVDLSGSGFVVGPPSATNGSIAIYDGTTGKLITDSLLFVDSGGNLSVGGNTIISGDLTVLGNITGLDLAASGFVVGPASATDNGIAVYDGTTGKLIKDSAATIDSLGNITANSITVNNVINSGTVINSLVASTGVSFTLGDSYYNAIVSGTTTVFAPLSPASGVTYVIKDVDGVAGTTPITVNGNGNTIDGSSTSQLASDYEAITLIFGLTEWNII